MKINSLSFGGQIKTDIYKNIIIFPAVKKCTKIEWHFCKLRKVINLLKKVINKRSKNVFSTFFDRSFLHDFPHD